MGKTFSYNSANVGVRVYRVSENQIGEAVMDFMERVTHSNQRLTKNFLFDELSREPDGQFLQCHGWRYLICYRK